MVGEVRLYMKMKIIEFSLNPSLFSVYFKEVAKCKTLCEIGFDRYDGRKVSSVFMIKFRSNHYPSL